ncbi:MAG: hypothetical protein K5876_07660 [Ruminiclostridium sp.]|nr:hypothetical protein [Ruminiclostridium sp.]
MNEVWEKELLNELRDLFAEAGRNAEIENISGREVLVAEYEGENEPEDCNVSVVHLMEDTTEISVLISVRSGLDEKQSADIAALVPYLNRFLSIGCFGNEDGYFWYSCSFVIDEDMERSILIKQITASVNIALNTAAEATAMILPVVNGEAHVSELMNEDTSIVQF